MLICLPPTVRSTSLREEKVLDMDPTCEAAPMRGVLKTLKINPVWWRRDWISFISGSTSTQRQAARSQLGPIDLDRPTNTATAVYDSKSEWTPDGNRGDHERARVIGKHRGETQGAPRCTCGLQASLTGGTPEPETALARESEDTGPKAGSSPAGSYLRIPSRLITSRYFFRLWSRRYFSRLDLFETIISSPRRLAWSLACVLK